MNNKNDAGNASLKPASNSRGQPGTKDVSTQSRRNEASTTSKTTVPNTSNVTIAVMGASGTGKTTFINTASNSSLRVGAGLQSCTSVVQLSQSFELNGCRVTLIDTPGFDDTTKSDADILRMIAEFLATEYENGRKLAGVIYIHRISDFRMGGVATRNFKMFHKLCGESALKNVAIVTNMWSEVKEGVGIARETELASDDMFFKPVLDNGAQMLRHANTPASAHAIIARIIDNHPVPLQIQKELIDEKMDIGQTAAGQELNRELNIRLEKHKKEMDAIRQEMEEAIRDKDEESRQELEDAKRKLQVEMSRAQDEREKLASKRAPEPKEPPKPAQERNELPPKNDERTYPEDDPRIQNPSALPQQTPDERAPAADKVEVIEDSGIRAFFRRIGRAFASIFA